MKNQDNSPWRGLSASPPTARSARKTWLAPLVKTAVLFGALASTSLAAQAATRTASSEQNIKDYIAASNYGDTVEIAYRGNPYVIDTPLTVPTGVKIVGLPNGGNKPIIRASFGATVEQDLDIISFGFDGTNTVINAYETNNVQALKGIFNVPNANGNEFSNLLIDGQRWGDNHNADAAVAVGAGIIMENNTGAQSKVFNCQFYDLRGAGIFVRGGSNYDLGPNYFNDCGFDESRYVDRGNLIPDTSCSVNGSGQACDSDGSSGEITTKNANGLTIHGSQFVSDLVGVGRDGGYPSGYGIKEIGGDITVDDNDFTLCETQAYLNTSSNFDIEFWGKVLIHNNRFKNVVSAGSGGSTGIINDNTFVNGNTYNYGVEANGTNLIVDHNTFSGAAGFVRTFGLNRPQNLTVTRNIIKGGGSFISLANGADGLNVFHNTVELNSTDKTGGGDPEGTAFIKVSRDNNPKNNNPRTDPSNDWEIKNNIVLASAANTPLIDIGDNTPTPLGVQVYNNLLNNIDNRGFSAVGADGNISGNPNLDSNKVPASDSIAIDAGTDIKNQSGSNSVPNFYGYYAQAGRGFDYIGTPDLGWKEVGSKTGGSSGGSASYYRIRSRWVYNAGAPDYLYDGGTLAKYGPLTSGSDALYQWEAIVTNDGTTRFKNRSTSDVLNIENFNTNNDGNLRCDQAGDNGPDGRTGGWLSSRWKRQPTEQGYERYENDWKPNNYIHIEGRPANVLYGSINKGGNTTNDYGWYSAQWTLEAVTGADADAPTNLNAG